MQRTSSAGLYITASGEASSCAIAPHARDEMRWGWRACSLFPLLPPHILTAQCTAVTCCHSRMKLSSLMEKAAQLKPYSVRLESIEAQIRRQQFLLERTRLALEHQLLERNAHLAFHRIVKSVICLLCVFRLFVVSSSCSLQRSSTEAFVLAAVSHTHTHTRTHAHTHTHTHVHSSHNPTGGERCEEEEAGRIRELVEAAAATVLQHHEHRSNRIERALL